MEKAAHENIAMAWPEFGYSVVAADAFLALGDSVAALRLARFFVDTAMAVMPLDPPFIRTAVATLPSTALWPRMMLLRADLATAPGQRDEARLWYGRVVDLWAEADPALKPTIARIRAALGREPSGGGARE